MVKQSILGIKENDMVAIEFGYNTSSLVMSPKDALAMAEIMQRAEKYEKKYRPGGGGIESTYTYHVWPNPDEITMKLISDDIYRMAKLAGKPEKD
jgi:hypothetical protein